MIKVTVGGKDYQVKFWYDRAFPLSIVPKNWETMTDEERVTWSSANYTKATEPTDTYTAITGEGVTLAGRALLHPNDEGRFRYTTGRKLALANAIANHPNIWTHEERKEFWNQMFRYTRDGYKVSQPA